MITPIPTRYAGHEFRSRLEARWAVFFDTCHIRWHYETQGYFVSERLYPGSDVKFTYLPDFWLPDHELWIEVKGALNEDECWKLLNAAASLSSNDGAGCHDNGGNDLVVLGPVPQGPSLVPIRLHMHKGDLEAIPWDPFSGRPRCNTHRHRLNNHEFETIPDGLFPVITDSGDLNNSAVGSTLTEVARFLLGGMTNPWSGSLTQRRYAAALDDARTARFEHGQSGRRS